MEAGNFKIYHEFRRKAELPIYYEPGSKTFSCIIKRIQHELLKTLRVGENLKIMLFF